MAQLRRAQGTGPEPTNYNGNKWQPAALSPRLKCAEIIRRHHCLVVSAVISLGAAGTVAPALISRPDPGIIGNLASSIKWTSGQSEAETGMKTMSRVRRISAANRPSEMPRGGLRLRQIRPRFSSWPGLSRPSTSFLFAGAKAWMPGTKPGHDERDPECPNVPPAF